MGSIGLYYRAREEMTAAMYRHLMEEPKPPNVPDIMLGDYCPESTLKLKRDMPMRSKFRAINCHCHLSAVTAEDVVAGVAEMDISNMEVRILFASNFVRGAS